VQVIIALVVTPEGLPLAYEVLPGNTKDDTTLRGFLDRIERQYGKARRIWLMDRGVPTTAVLPTGQARGLKAHAMRAADPPVQYLVGTPKGRLTRLEKALVAKPWHDARPGVQSLPRRRPGSNSYPRMASSTSSPKAPTGLPRSGQSAAASSNGCGRASNNSLA
jgi:hypothetical protein